MQKEQGRSSCLEDTRTSLPKGHRSRKEEMDADPWQILRSSSSMLPGLLAACHHDPAHAMARPSSWEGTHEMMCKAAGREAKGFALGLEDAKGTEKLLLESYPSSGNRGEHLQCL